MITIKNLSKKYGKKKVLEGLSFDFSKGAYGILGTNGAGKTTLIRCIAGMHGYTGEISIDKEKNIGYLPQQSGIFPNLSIYENLYFYAELKHIAKDKRNDEIEKVINLVNLDDNTQTKGKKLSGGMKRRVGIAAALLGQPEILLFDEPTVGLDPEERLRFKQIIRVLKKETTILMSTHIVEDVEATADNIIIIDRGIIKASGSTDDIKSIAKGKVFEIDPDEVSRDDYVIREEDRGDRIVSRIITRNPRESVFSVEATVEDGYICSIKEI